MRCTVRVGGMAEVRYGVRALNMLHAEALGRYAVLFSGPWTDLDALREVLAYARAHGFRFIMDEPLDRLSGDVREAYRELGTETLAALFAEYAEHCDGTLILPEYGGVMLYWPPATTAGARVTLGNTSDYEEADRRMVACLRARIAYAARLGLVARPVTIEASGLVSRFLYRAGMARVDLEVTYTPRDELMYAAAKGAALAYGRERFGADMAMVWYGGNQHDKLWRRRWRMSLYHAFLRGADPIYVEHGVMDYCALGKELDADAPEVRALRAELADFAAFAAAHPRPAGFPRAEMAVMIGRLDSYTGMDSQTHRWGQHDNDAARHGAAERSWDLFETFYRRHPWQYRYKTGDVDYSGNPPSGQVDVVPADAPAAVLARYRALVFLGWNSMDETLYRTLVGYVEQGGHLLMTAAHLDTAAAAGAPLRLFRDGDVRELFGVALDASAARSLACGLKFRASPPGYAFPLWTRQCDPKYVGGGGFRLAGLNLAGAEPLAHGSDRFNDAAWNDGEIVLTGHRVGRGMALLANSLDYPGADGLRAFYGDLLGFMATAHQPALRVECSDRVRFARYGDGDDECLYLLNTEEHLRQEARLFNGADEPVAITLAPGELREVAVAQRA